MKYEPTGLIGMKEITDYTRRSESTVLILIRTQGFPAIKICGNTWESDKILIDQWRREQISASINSNGDKDKKKFKPA